MLKGTFKKYSNIKTAPIIILYQPNPLKPCLFKTPIKNLMAKMATMKAMMLPKTNNEISC